MPSSMLTRPWRPSTPLYSFIAAAVVVLLSCARIVHADTAFINPPPFTEVNPIDIAYPLGARQNFTWTSNYTDFTVALVQVDTNQSSDLFGTIVSYDLFPATNSSYLLWDGLFGPYQDPNASLAFALVLFVPEHRGYIANSALFNITLENNSSSTSTLTSTTTTSSSSSSSSTSTAIGSSTNSSDNNALAIGLGVGLGVGLGLVIAILIFLLLRMLHTRRLAEKDDGGSGNGGEGVHNANTAATAAASDDPGLAPKTGEVLGSKAHNTLEMSTEQRIHELSDGARQAWIGGEARS